MTDAFWQTPAVHHRPAWFICAACNAPVDRVEVVGSQNFGRGTEFVVYCHGMRQVTGYSQHDLRSVSERRPLMWDSRSATPSPALLEAARHLNEEVFPRGSAERADMLRILARWNEEDEKK